MMLMATPMDLLNQGGLLLARFLLPQQRVIEDAEA